MKFLDFGLLPRTLFWSKSVLTFFRINSKVRAIKFYLIKKKVYLLYELLPLHSLNIWKVKISIRWNCLILACPQGPIFEVREFLLFDTLTLGQGLHNPACLSKCVSFCMCYCSLKTEKSEKSQFSIGENSRFWPPPLDPFFKVRAFVVFYVKYKTSATTDWLFF